MKRSFFFGFLLMSSLALAEEPSIECRVQVALKINDAEGKALGPDKNKICYQFGRPFELDPISKAPAECQYETLHAQLSSFTLKFAPTESQGQKISYSPDPSKFPAEFRKTLETRGLEVSLAPFGLKSSRKNAVMDIRIDSPTKTFTGSGATSHEIHLDTIDSLFKEGASLSLVQSIDVDCQAVKKPASASINKSFRGSTEKAALRSTPSKVQGPAGFPQ
jgi:hypothetical protein